MQANTITEVIHQLDLIVEHSKKEASPLGYFAALYRKVTIAVKNKLGTGYFDDDQRMERLDVVFANRYLTAYHQYQNNEKPSESWEVAFQLSKDECLIVLQHLLLGMNAHINLDLGIAAAEITTALNINELKGDFDKINDLLAYLTKDVESELSQIWTPLPWILKRTRKIDNFLIGFNMKLARNGAWKFAKELSIKQGIEKEQFIIQRDKNVALLVDLIIGKRIWLERAIFWLVRKGERGNVVDRIKILEETTLA